MTTAALDPDLLNQVCDNLLDNTAKYSPSGSHITFAAMEDGECIRVEVTVCGVSVPEEDLPQLFESFFRSDRSRSRQSGGVGLGLTLCKRIIKGMTFSFEIPLSQNSKSH